jgi:hypothetical protein
LQLDGAPIVLREFVEADHDAKTAAHYLRTRSSTRI